MPQISTIIIGDKSYFLPEVDHQYFKGDAVLKMPKATEKNPMPDWFIYFSVWNFEEGKWKPVKYYTDFLNTKEALNLPKKQRERQGDLMVLECNLQLKAGINPQSKIAIAPFDNKTLLEFFENEKDNDNLPRLKEAIEIFIKVKCDLVGGSVQAENKENTAVTYKYFFNKFLNYCEGEKIGNLKINKFTKQQVYEFMQDYLHSGVWSAVTYNSNLGFIKSFFNYFSKIYDFTHYIGNIEDVEVTEETERFEPFTEGDIIRIFNYIGSSYQVIYPHYIRTYQPNDYLLLLCRTIFYSFLRPSEIRRLKIKHVKRYAQGYFDLTKDITKNKKVQARYKELYIDPVLVEEFRKLNWEKYFNKKECENYYVFTRDLVPSETPIPSHYSGKAFSRALERLDAIRQTKGDDGLTNFADAKYSLYSLKHTGNILSYKSGWSIAQLQLQNRHSSEEQTENYLRDLKQEINLAPRPVRLAF